LYHLEAFLPYRINCIFIHTISSLCFTIQSLRSSRDKKRVATGIDSEQQEGGVGYLSDGHGSGVSSDNESSSVFSEMVGRALIIAGTYL